MTPYSSQPAKPSMTMATDDAPTLTIGVFHRRIEEHVAGHFSSIERNTLAWYDKVVNKYSTTLNELRSRTGRSRRPS